MQDSFENLWNNILAFVPNLLGALVVLLIGWLIAKGIKAVVVKLLRKTSWDEKIFKPGQGGDSNTT